MASNEMKVFPAGTTGEEDDPERLLDEWLGELGVLTGGLECSSGRPLSHEIAAPRMDSYRFSMANLEDTQDVDLDAILGELCALETRYDQEIKMGPTGSRPKSHVNNGRPTPPPRRASQDTPTPAAPQRTDSPDNDSAFSDTVSLLSSESSASSGASAGNKIQVPSIHHSTDSASQLKAEKIRLALSKMTEASEQKLFMKAFSIDGSSKCLLIDAKMTCGNVTRILADKNHVAMEPHWAIVEYLHELQMERVFEDHEIVIENLLLWTRDSKNKIIFMARPEKIAFFQKPEVYLRNPTDFVNEYDEHSRTIVLEDFFARPSETCGLQSTASAALTPGHPIPNMEGALYMKSDYKKGWKKYIFHMKASGLIYYPKEKNRMPVCVANLDINDIYVGINWKKKFKAPTNFCFAIKNPKLQEAKSIKYVKLFCADSELALDKWMVALRLAKHGKQLLSNYRSLLDDLAQDDIDKLANARSCSVTSFTHNNGTHITPQPGNNRSLVSQDPTNSDNGRHSRASSSSSSGCISSSDSHTPFDSENTTGTIKRKPSLKPNIPLTSMTRQLKEIADASCIGDDADLSNNAITNGTTYTLTGTLTRRHSRRKSSSADDGSSSGTLKRFTKDQLGIPQPQLPSVNTSTINNGSFQEMSLAPVLSECSNRLDHTLSKESSFGSNVSLDSLPPPPSPYEVSMLAEYDWAGSQGSLSFPLPPLPVDDSINEHSSNCISVCKLVHKLCLNCDGSISSPQTPYWENRNHNPDGSLLSGSNVAVRFNHGHSVQHNSELPSPLCTPDTDLPEHTICSSRNIDTGILGATSTLPTCLHHTSYASCLQELKQKTSVSAGSLTKSASQESCRTLVTMNEGCPTELIISSPSSPHSYPTKKVSFENAPNLKLSGKTPNSSPTKPPLPKRNEGTKLSSPIKLALSPSNPPKEFFSDLQRVMRKKWQVAQKCKLEPTTSPHEVLGFREYPLSHYKEANVSNWVQEHYGRSGNFNISDNLYENSIASKERADCLNDQISLRRPHNCIKNGTLNSITNNKSEDSSNVLTTSKLLGETESRASTSTMGNHLVSSSGLCEDGNNTNSNLESPTRSNDNGDCSSSLLRGMDGRLSRRRPPPPPPKRSEATHLTNSQPINYRFL